MNGTGGNWFALVKALAASQTVLVTFSGLLIAGALDVTGLPSYVIRVSYRIKQGKPTFFILSLTGEAKISSVVQCFAAVEVVFLITLPTFLRLSRGLYETRAATLKERPSAASRFAS